VRNSSPPSSPNAIERHRKAGDTRYLVEPNVKEGKGGLRDLHTLFWIAKYYYRHPRTGRNWSSSASSRARNTSSSGRRTISSGPFAATCTF
jgi:hypothetical protein